MSVDPRVEAVARVFRSFDGELSIGLEEYFRYAEEALAAADGVGAQ